MSTRGEGRSGDHRTVGQRNGQAMAGPQGSAKDRVRRWCGAPPGMGTTRGRAIRSGAACEVRSHDIIPYNRCLHAADVLEGNLWALHFHQRRGILTLPTGPDPSVNNFAVFCRVNSEASCQIDIGNRIIQFDAFAILDHSLFDLADAREQASM